MVKCGAFNSKNGRWFDAIAGIPGILINELFKLKLMVYIRETVEIFLLFFLHMDTSRSKLILYMV